MTDEQKSRTVHIVLGNYADDPHPHVEGVYNNEDAAEAHKNAIGNALTISGPVAWGVETQEVKSAVTDCPVCDTDLTNGTIVDDDTKIVETSVRCPECTTKVPKTF